MTTQTIEPSWDTAGIERATLAAVAPKAVQELPGWLLPMDSGTIGRAHSAVPLSHAASHADPALIAVIARQYADSGMQAKFRLPDVPAFAPMRAALHSMGYAPAFPTLVQVGTVAALRAVTAHAPAEMMDLPDAGWVRVFLGKGASSAANASRVDNFRRGAGVVFASVRQNAAQGGATLAIGAGAFSHGWVCVHGVNTLAAHRGQGLAARVLAGIADVAQQRGMQQAFLQVEEDNTSALALYRRAGMETAWKYVYWQLPATPGAAKAVC